MMVAHTRCSGMLRRIAAFATLAVLVLWVEPAALYAADWKWPAQMSIAGFRVTGIRGSTRPDGSGTATGTLQIPRVAGQKVSLTRSSRGEVTGQASIKARVSRTEIQGKFKLTKAGLKATGATVKTSPKPITNASISVSSRGEFKGTGRLGLGRITLTTRFTISGTSFNVSGSTSVQGQEDTPLATYKFQGRLSLRGSSGRIDGRADGTVERTGKLADKVTTYSVSNAAVNLSNGHCTVNAGGVRVTFKLF